MTCMVGNDNWINYFNRNVGLSAPKYPEEVVSTYVNRVGAQGGKNNWIYCFSILCCMYNRMPGETCTGPIGAQYGTQIGNIGSTGAGGAVRGVAVGIGTLAKADPEPISKTILSVVSFFTGIFGAHHAAAVARDNAAMCDVAAAWASFADIMEASLQNGQIDLQTAQQQLSNACAQLYSRLASSENQSQQNAPWGHHKAIDALKLFNSEYVYPSLVPSATQQLIGSTGGKVALIGGAGLIGAKILGVF